MQAEIGTILQNIYKHEQSQLQLFLTHKAISKYIKKIKKNLYRFSSEFSPKHRVHN